MNNVVVGTLNKKDIEMVPDKLDCYGKNLLLWNGHEITFDSLVRILPYDQNSKFDLEKFNQDQD